MTRSVPMVTILLSLVGCEKPATYAPPLPVETIETVPYYEAGHIVRQVEVTEVEELTIVDLSDDYAPHIFAPAPEMGELGTPPYRSTYVMLADEQLDALPDDVEPERYLEVFGIFPTFRVLGERLGDEERHACHAAVDDDLLHDLPYVMKSTEIDVPGGRQRVRAFERELPLFEAEREALELDSVDALDGVTSRQRQFTQFFKDRRRVETIRAVQAHLRCDGMGRAVDGVFDEPTSEALTQWQRQHMLYAAGSLDATTIETMRVNSRELDFRAVLRALRERVGGATGVIEDGSARQEWGTILDRVIDAPELRFGAGHEPRENGAPDWLSPATEATARGLGWTSPEAFVAFAQQDERPTQIAVRLPPKPAYHSAHMTMRAEVDRGDLSYDLPRTVRTPLPLNRRPILTLFAQDGDREVAVVQWPTTIGGWMREVARGGIALEYKESPPGPRVWRDVVAAPAWIPPRSTPVSDLIRYVSRDRVVPNTTLFGPGYRSAYGLAMVVHHRLADSDMGAGELLVDEGVRTHGSVSYRSILTGASHGCHRLHNHLALRLTRFLLAHRFHNRRGSLLVRHSREIRTSLGTTTFQIPSRGYAYELTPPVEVNVLEGNVVGRRRTPDPRAHPLRPQDESTGLDE